jgi:hypothetical protein
LGNDDAITDVRVGGSGGVGIAKVLSKVFKLRFWKNGWTMPHEKFHMDILAKEAIKPTSIFP